ncbi:hypothetical protein WJX84_007485 [Apatococcus fuscideae]|uniref:Exostosin GT47 domain-containing protein n=1 Tax=Apatococcus fuscideae TaxID=2026836 RepID=A0AAW1SIW7_9CHLO
MPTQALALVKQAGRGKAAWRKMNGHVAIAGASQGLSQQCSQTAGAILAGWQADALVCAMRIQPCASAMGRLAAVWLRLSHLQGDHGESVDYGGIEPELLFGSQGWCEAEQPAHKCACILDGLEGDLCEVRTQTVCSAQCQGHGDCRRSFCHYHPGYWGHDCANLRLGSPSLPGAAEAKPWLANWAQQDILPAPVRPLIYIYDLPPIYNSRMLEYRSTKSACVYRQFDQDNMTVWPTWGYRSEPALHESLLLSKFRTLDPESADFFYVPVYTSCYLCMAGLMHPGLVPMGNLMEALEVMDLRRAYGCRSSAMRESHCRSALTAATTPLNYF